MSEEIYCTKCRFYRKAGEVVVDIGFVDGFKEGRYGMPRKPQGTIRTDGFGAIRMCQHKICFRKKRIKTIISSMIVKERILGQGQLNKNNDCELFEPNIRTRIKRFINRK